MIALNNISLHPNAHTSGKKDQESKGKNRASLTSGIVAVVMEKMRSHRESISLIKGETGTGTPVAKADTSIRIQRQRKFMPVPCRRRQAYDVPSTVSRGAYTVDLPILLRLLIRPPVLSSLARSSADHSSPSLSADGEPLSKSYATQRRSSARALIIFPRAAVPEFLNGG